jgi:hypothetical protein
MLGGGQNGLGPAEVDNGLLRLEPEDDTIEDISFPVGVFVDDGGMFGFMQR